MGRRKRADPNSRLFSKQARTAYSIVEKPSRRFSHAFGGPARHDGVIPRGAPRPVHLVYEFDLGDPRVGIQIPGVRRLPLYYGFQYEGCSLGYRVLADDRIEILDMPMTTISDNFPHEDYPDQFPHLPCDLKAIPLDLHDPETLFRYSGVFGLEGLSAEDEAALISYLRGEFGIFFQDPVPDSIDELIGGIFDPLFAQGAPRSVCPDPACPNRNVAGRLDVIALVGSHPAPDVHLWGEYETDVQVIFGMCPVCRAIHATNQCT